MQRVYLDNAATTQVLPEVIEAMLPYYTTYYGNPSGFHAFSREAHKGLDDARKTVAACLNAASPDEITFTGGGSEGDNMILRGVAKANRKKGNHIITTTQKKEKSSSHHAAQRLITGSLKAWQTHAKTKATTSLRRKSSITRSCIR